MSRCEGCRQPIEATNAWIRVGRHEGRPLARLDLCNRCGDALVALLRDSSTPVFPLRGAP